MRRYSGWVFFLNRKDASKREDKYICFQRKKIYLGEDHMYFSKKHASKGK